MMKSLRLFCLLAALGHTSASIQPRFQSGDVLLKSRPGSQRKQDHARLSDKANNHSLAVAAMDGSFGGFNLFARQDDGCRPGKYSCGDGYCCPNGQNCVANGCCDKPMVACGSEGCYDADTEICCEERSTHCKKGYECMPEGGCCREGRISCGEESCYDQDTEVCCDDGSVCDDGETCLGDGVCCEGKGTKQCGDDKCYDPSEAKCCRGGSADFWGCPKDQECCEASGGCYDPKTEKCCEVGACSSKNGGTCCDEECCDGNERCGLDGFCTAKVTETLGPTTTSAESAPTEPPANDVTGEDGDDDDDGPSRRPPLGGSRGGGDRDNLAPDNTDAADRPGVQMGVFGLVVAVGYLLL